ncbi:PepSY-associated TM helix domain-containing protein [Pseudoalteromonas piscicida]|uniref:Peptidase n=1 Tax=Pseudoalteromonas piscicida TaxID=43662 RepID=A0A2A5JN96_PSEO7|nr:PepSY-associated TM helix domain-containing protein [Pseudoalteromonas piscicida]PCK30944.1 peptidase [Pseudoalteromonas piscicida]
MTIKKWFHWHSLSGVWCGLLLFLICWTGAFASISYELDWLFDNKVRAGNGVQKVDLASAYEKVKQTYPQARIGIAFAGQATNFAHDFVLRFPDGPWQHVYVDPSTGRIQGKTSFLNTQRFFRDFHMHFFNVFDHPVSYYLVLLFSIPLSLSIITALYLYRGWWRKLLSLHRTGDTRAKVASLHKLSGVWSVWFAVVIALTSIWYLFEFIRMDLGDGKTAFSDVGMFAVHSLPELKPQDKPRLSVTALTAIVKKMRPSFEVKAIRYSGGYFYVEGQSDEWLVRDRGNKVYLNPYSGTVVYSQTASSQGLYWRLSDTVDPLHFGNFAGMWVKILWCVFALLLAFLALSGTYMYIKRQLKLRRKETVLGVKISLAFSVGLLLCITNYAYETLMSYGEGGNFPLLPTSTSLFLLGWTLLTGLIITLWVGALIRLCREVKTKNKVHLREKI